MTDETKKDFRTVVGEAIGEASMCWSERPTGIFDSTRASAIVDKIFDAFHLEAGMNVTRWVEVVRQNAKLKAELDACHAHMEAEQKKLTELLIERNRNAVLAVENYNRINGLRNEANEQLAAAKEEIAKLKFAGAKLRQNNDRLVEALKKVSSDFYHSPDCGFEDDGHRSTACQNCIVDAALSAGEVAYVDPNQLKLEEPPDPASVLSPRAETLD